MSALCIRLCLSLPTVENMLPKRKEIYNLLKTVSLLSRLTCFKLPFLVNQAATRTPWERKPKDRAWLVCIGVQSDVGEGPGGQRVLHVWRVSHRVVTVRVSGYQRTRSNRWWGQEKDEKELRWHLEHNKGNVRNFGKFAQMREIERTHRQDWLQLNDMAHNKELWNSL